MPVYAVTSCCKNRRFTSRFVSGVKKETRIVPAFSLIRSFCARKNPCKMPYPLGAKGEGGGGVKEKVLNAPPLFLCSRGN